MRTMKPFIPATVAALLLTGCSLTIGGQTSTRPQAPPTSVVTVVVTQTAESQEAPPTKEESSTIVLSNRGVGQWSFGTRMSVLQPILVERFGPMKTRSDLGCPQFQGNTKVLFWEKIQLFFTTKSKSDSNYTLSSWMAPLADIPEGVAIDDSQPMNPSYAELKATFPEGRHSAGPPLSTFEVDGYLYTGSVDADSPDTLNAGEVQLCE